MTALEAIIDAERQLAIHRLEYTEGECTEVEDDRSVHLGSSVFGGYPKDAPLPQVGDKVRWYTKQLSRVRGADHNGVLAWWKTDAQLESQRKADALKRRLDNDKKFEKKKAQLDTDYEALSEPLQARISSLRLAGGDAWRADHESYEMFCCTEAMKLVDHFRDNGGLEGLVQFNKATSDQQKTQVPTLAYEEHSGNTFGFALGLAAELLDGNPGTAAVLPAAMSPISGDPRYLRSTDNE